MNLYYVAISRARQEARVYTNSIQALPTAITRRIDKSTALEIQHHPQLHRGGADMHPKGLGDGKQVMHHQLEKQRTQVDIGRKLLRDGRFV